jgi:type III secretion system low calcium response chaperone LcrH/SycD
MQKKLLEQLNEEITHQVIEPLVQEVVKNRKENPFENNALFAKKLMVQMQAALEGYETNLIHAIQILEKQGAWPHDDNRFKKFQLHLENKEDIQKELETGKTLQEMLQLTNEEMTKFYQIGLALFEHHHYDQSTTLFTFLTQLNPLVAGFWAGVGASQDKLGEHLQALQAFALAAELDDESLSSYLHAANSCLLLNNKAEAKKILERALERTQEHEFEFKSEVEEMLKAII